MQMSSNNRCPGLINSSNVYEYDKAPLRVAVVDGCHFTFVYYLNMISEALNRPLIVTYCDGYGKPINNQWTGVLGELTNNRSDFSLSVAPIIYAWYHLIDYTPTISYGNALTIFTGKLLANNGDMFAIFNSFSSDIWLIFSVMLVISSICKNIQIEICSIYSTLTSGRLIKIGCNF